MMAADGSHSIGAGEQARRPWTVEGLAAGTHALQMDVEGELHRRAGRPSRWQPARRPRSRSSTRASTSSSAIPDVVREDTPYSLFVTVTNLSRVTQNLVSVADSG